MIKAIEVLCRKIRGGKKSLWHARHPNHNLTGAGNSPDTAIKDLRDQHRLTTRITLIPK